MRTHRRTRQCCVGVEMRAHLCRLLLYQPSAVLYLKLQLQNLCNFSPTPPFKAFHREYMHVNAPFLFAALLLTCLCLFDLSLQLQGWRYPPLCCITVCFTHRSLWKKKKDGGCWLRGGQLIIVMDRRRHAHTHTHVREKRWSRRRSSLWTHQIIFPSIYKGGD